MSNSKKTKRKRKNKSIGLMIVCLSFIFLVSAVIFISGNLKDENKFKGGKSTKTTTTEPHLKIVDPESKERNVAVMINNIKKVWGYQSGLQDAYLVYEIITEGGITRLMAIYKGASTARIGSVRSARIYFLDYALENDAIYVHVGGSKEALSDIKTLKMADLNAQTIFRDRTLNLPFEHTAFTSIEKIEDKVSSRKMRNTTDEDLLLDYSIKELDLSKYEGAVEAKNIYISYSGSKSTTFKYDEENKVYLRFQNDTPHMDYVTKKQYTAKNIITYQVKNYSYDSYGRQALKNIGEGKGYYISNGYAVPITWKKSSRTGKTIYRLENGEELKVNDGNTYIQIQPLNRELKLN